MVRILSEQERCYGKAGGSDRILSPLLRFLLIALAPISNLLEGHKPTPVT
ncbi:hypothetical protein H6F74_13185 [Trichocoleus sp. FACHB-90]|nr:hypothetical protein [Trichocoleus sp. FACHB-90]MBD1927192.1 hypothetical protein [Trichocoleus sp. FACHB-90]